MPIEIKELIIRASVGQDRRAQGASDEGGDAIRPHGTPAVVLSQGEFDRIVSTCVERVLEVIKKSQEG